MDLITMFPPLLDPVFGLGADPVELTTGAA